MVGTIFGNRVGSFPKNLYLQRFARLYLHCVVHGHCQPQTVKSRPQIGPMLLGTLMVIILISPFSKHRFFILPQPAQNLYAQKKEAA